MQFDLIPELWAVLRKFFQRLRHLTTAQSQSGARACWKLVTSSLVDQHRIQAPKTVPLWGGRGKVLHPEWHPISYIVHYTGDMVPFGTQMMYNPLNSAPLRAARDS
ncbi:unnamed protein product [Oncorhynchus mykiss]|uniref:Uncharacterized protein n=1 Tax=Oncorhynchus mykiss TaxID=8022 RepID=A0A060XAS2_ONCMY|nr:unnamed protein product [Oncorhynchus mykiss]